jgi:hypothetical protein
VAAEDAAKIQAASGRESIDFLEESRDLSRSDLAAFRDFGERGLARVDDFLESGNPVLDQAQSLLTRDLTGPSLSQAEALLTPEGQAEFLGSNPILDAAMDRVTRETNALNAASGRSGGGVVDQLFQNFLGMGDQFLNSQFNRLGAADRLFQSGFNRDIQSLGTVDALRGNEFNRLLAPINTGLGAATGQANTTQATGSNVANTITDIGAAQAGGIIGGANARAAGFNNLFGMGAGGLLGSGLLGGAGLAGGGLTGAGLGALMFSDERLKDIDSHIGYDENGLPIYKWKYKGDDKTHYGPMAQDVINVKPEAVYVHKTGNLMLDMREV